MPQQKYSLPDFAAQIRQKTGKGKQMTDVQLVQAWVREYPGDKDHLDDSTGILGAMETGAELLGQNKPATPVPDAAPKPLPLEGYAAQLPGGMGSLAKDTLLTPLLPNPTKVNLPFGPKGLNLGHVLPNSGPAPVNPSSIYKVAREVSTPLDLASGGSLAGARLAAKYGVKGLATAAPLLDRGASAALAGIGASDVIDAATSSESSPFDRLLQGGVGVLLGAAGMAGMRNPLGMPSRVPTVAPPVPAAPPPLALPPIHGTTPTTTRFYAGPAGMADAQAKYPVHLTRPADPLLGNPDALATPTPGEIGQLRDLPTIEAARGPHLSGLHGTGAPIPDTPENAEAIFARQIADIMRKGPATPPKGLPSAAGTELPRGNVPQTGSGGAVDFGSDAAKGIPPAKALEGEVLPAPTVYKAGTKWFVDEQEAVEYALENGIPAIQIRNGKKVETVAIDPEQFGKVDLSLLRPLAGGLVGGAAGAAQGETPGERIGLGLLGAVGGGVLGAPKRAGRFVRDAAEKAYGPVEPLPSFPPLPKVGSSEHAESVMARVRNERGQVRFPRGTNPDEMLKGMKVPGKMQVGDLPTDPVEAQKFLRKALGQEGFIESVLARRMATGAAGALTGGAVGETPEERVKLGVIGGFVGAALPRSAARVPKRVPHVSQKGQDLLIAQAKEGKRGQDSAFPLGVGTTLKRDYVTRFAPQDKLDDMVEKNIGRKLGAAERSGDTNRQVLGGQSGRVRAAMLDLEDTVEAARKGGVDEEARNYLNMKGLLHGHATLLKKAGKMTGQERKELLRRIESGEVFPLKFTAKEAAEAVRLAEQSPNFGKVKEAAETIFKFNRETLEKLHTSGVISKEAYDELAGRGIEYVPLFRRTEGGLIDGAGNDVAANLEREMTDYWKSAGLSLKQIKSIKKLMGSERITQDPYQASLYLRQLAERELGRNEAAKTLYNLKSIDPEGVGKLIVPLDTFAPGGKKLGKKSPPPGYGEITFRENGEVMSYAVPKEIADMQLLVHGQSLVAGMSALGQLLGAAKSTLQATATGLNIVFSVGNVPRDFDTSRRFLKPNKMTPMDRVRNVNEWRKALSSRLKQDENFREALRSRSLHGTLQESFTPTALVIGGERSGPLKKVINGMGEFSKILEETTKVMAYNQMKKTGAATADIAKEVRQFGGSPDFADMGTKVSEGFNLAFMFLNPAIQGIAQNVRGIARNPTKAMAQLGMAVGGAIALHKYNSQYVAEDGRPEIEHVPKFDRDTSFVIILPMKDEKSGRHFYLTVYKKSHAARLFYNATQDAVQMAAGDTNITPAQVGLDVVSQFLPGSVGLKADNLQGSVGRSVLASANPLVRIPVEQFGNFKAFEGVPIESQRLRSLPPELRYDSTTGKTYRRVGEMTGLSPKKIQHAYEGIFNAPGRMFMGGLDAVQSPTSINVDTMDKVKKVPLLGQLAGSWVRAGRDEKLSQGVEEIYSRAEKAKQERAAYRDAQTRRPSLKGKVNKDVAKEAAMLEGVTRQLSALRRIREEILSGERKVSDPKDQLRKIRERETKIVELTMKRLTKGEK